MWHYSTGALGSAVPCQRASTARWQGTYHAQLDTRLPIRPGILALSARASFSHFRMRPAVAAPRSRLALLTTRPVVVAIPAMALRISA